MDIVKKWAPIIIVSAIVGYGVIWALKRFAPSIAAKIPGVA